MCSDRRTNHEQLEKENARKDADAIKSQAKREELIAAKIQFLADITERKPAREAKAKKMPELTAEQRQKFIDGTPWAGMSAIYFAGIFGKPLNRRGSENETWIYLIGNAEFQRDKLVAWSWFEPIDKPALGNGQTNSRPRTIKDAMGPPPK